MTVSLSEKDYKEGLIVSCFDLFESYGNDLCKGIDDLIEKPHFCIGYSNPLTDEEKEEVFLATAGYALSRSKISNIVIEYFIRTGNYSVKELKEIVNEIQRLANREFDD